MKYLLVSVKDRAADIFNRPFCARSAAEAVRLFSDAVNDKESPFNAHPDDYDLYALGEFEEDNGNVTKQEVSVIIRGKDVYRSATN